MWTTESYQLVTGLILGFCTVLAACNTKPVAYETITLHHDLGELHIRESAFFDTLNQWTHELDCDCCHLRKVRLGNTQFPVLLENGWKYSQPDSMQQLTISQPDKASCDTSFQVDYQEIQVQRKYIRGQYFQDPLWVYSKIETVDGFDFLVLGWEIEQYQRYNDQNLQQLLAITLIDGEKVTLDFNCRRQDCGNFLRRSFWLLQHMKIRPAKPKVSR